jgi:hypothetical protein
VQRDENQLPHSFWEPEVGVVLAESTRTEDLRLHDQSDIVLAEMSLMNA